MQSKEDVIKLIKDVVLPKDTDTSYTFSYSAMCNFFSMKDKISRDDVIVGIHMVYGWMPTIVHVNKDKVSEPKIDRIAELLNKVKDSQRLEKCELQEIVKVVNNSVIGTSKLLHFVNPEIYPIWDSRVCQTISGKSNPNNLDLYLEYINLCIAVCEDYVCKEPNLTKMREVELALYEYGKLKQKE